MARDDESPASDVRHASARKAAIGAVEQPSATGGVHEVADSLARLVIALTGADAGYAGIRQGDNLLCCTYFHRDEALPWNHAEPLEETGDKGGNTGALFPDELLGRFQVEAVLSVPILDAHQGLVGLVQVHKSEGDFTQEGRERAATLVSLASPSLQEAVVRQHLREAEEILDSVSERMEEAVEQQQLLNRLLARYPMLEPAQQPTGPTEAERDLIDYLRRSREHLSTILEGVSEGIIVHDPSGGLLHVNDSAVRMLGFQSKEDLLRLSIAEVFDAVQALDQGGHPLPGSLAPGVRAAQELRAAEATLRLRFHGTEEERSLVVRSTPVLDDTGQLRFTVTISTDITERVRIERLREQFLGMVTHELRSPLAAIKLGVALARESAPRESVELFQLFSEIDAHADRLLTLIGNLLDMAQVEAGTFSVIPFPTPVATAIDEAIARLPRTCAARVSVDLAPALPLVEIDAQRIAQVLVNLLSNAEKFSSRGAPIELRAHPKSGGGILIQVSNHGEGIPPDQFPLLFHKFSKLGQQNPGTGLGLAISKHIVEAHGGRIWVESSMEAHVTTFSFTIPIPPNG